ncbi:MAG TPA: TolC family protein [Vicinamibacterales bacterium]|nr:TolC family protein [Vicinamibacterales bacterium]
MRQRTFAIVVSAAALLGAAQAAGAQGRAQPTASLAPRYFDPVNGISLEEAIARAIENEPGLRAERTAIDVAHAQRQQAALRPNPSVSFERREEAGGADNQTSVMAEWPLDLFRRAGRIAVAEREVEAARHEVADRERLLAASVREQYGEVLAAIRDLNVIENLHTTIAGQHEIVRVRVEEGAAPPLERDLLDVEVRRLDAERLMRAARVDAAMIELKRLLGLDADAPLAVRETLEDVVRREHAVDPPVRDAAAQSGGPDSSDADVVRRRPDVRAAEADLRAAEARIEQARRDGRFDVSLFGGYMRMEGSFPQLAFGESGALERIHGVFHNVSAGAMVMVPLLNRNQGAIAAARAERAGAEARLRAAELQARAELAAARARDERARRAVAVYTEEARRLARQNLDVVRQTYDLGRATVFDVLAEERRYVETEQALTVALREAYEARTALVRALGEVR